MSSIASTLRRQARIDVADLRAGSGVMLAVAATLSVLPHQPALPCPLRALTGIPCPLCGMTTSVESTLHGQLGAALRANPGGIAAIVVAAVVLVRPPQRLCVSLFSLGATIAAMWIFELWRFAVL